MVISTQNACLIKITVTDHLNTCFLIFRSDTYSTCLKLTSLFESVLPIHLQPLTLTAGTICKRENHKAVCYFPPLRNEKLGWNIIISSPLQVEYSVARKQLLAFKMKAAHRETLERAGEMRDAWVISVHRGEWLRLAAGFAPGLEAPLFLGQIGPHAGPLLFVPQPSQAA